MDVIYKTDKKPPDKAVSKNTQTGSINISDGSQLAGLSLDHFKIILANTAIWALPVFWYIIPFGSWSNTFIRQALFFIINKATNHTLPLIKLTHLLLSKKNSSLAIRFGNGLP